MNKINRIILFFLLSMVLGACAGLPSVCDDTSIKSRLCDGTVKAGVRLESVGFALKLAVVGAINTGAYSGPEVVAVFKEAVELLDGPIVCSILKSRLDKHPLLFEPIAPYLKALAIDDVMYQKDRELLLSWINSILNILGSE